MRERLSGRGGLAFGLTAAAFGWAVALIGAAFVVPVYSGMSASSDGHTTVTHNYSSTLVDENGLRVLVPLGIPVLLVALVWFALHRKCAHGSRWSGGVAWTVVLLLGYFTLLTSISIGGFLLPIVVLLGGAAALTPACTRCAFP
jgi:hypothetical protein